MIGLFEKYTRSIMYGGTDGIITIFNLISGIEGSNQSPLLLLYLGVSILIGDAISMGFSDFLSIRAENRIESLPTTSEPHLYGLSTFFSFILFGCIPLLIYSVLSYTNKSHNYIYTFISIVFSLGVLGYVNSPEHSIKDKLKNSVEVVFYGSFASLTSFSISRMLSSVIKV